MNCEFGDNYDMMVRNRFICGIKSERIRATLLTDSDNETTLDQVFQKAVTKEQATQSNVAMNSTVNAVRRAKFNPEYRKKQGNKSSGFKQTNAKTSSTEQCDKCTNVLCVDTHRRIVVQGVFIVSKKDILLSSAGRRTRRHTRWVWMVRLWMTQRGMMGRTTDSQQTRVTATATELVHRQKKVMCTIYRVLVVLLLNL